MLFPFVESKARFIAEEILRHKRETKAKSFSRKERQERQESPPPMNANGRKLPHE
jgi:hypothetical protein